MSNDLISRKALIKDIVERCGCVPYLEDGKNRSPIYIDEIINHQPTAYDVDKVVEKLDKEAQMLYSINSFAPVKAWENELLIPIVKEGGV